MRRLREAAGKMEAECILKQARPAGHQDRAGCCRVPKMRKRDRGEERWRLTFPGRCDILEAQKSAQAPS